MDENSYLIKMHDASCFIPRGFWQLYVKINKYSPWVKIKYPSGLKFEIHLDRFGPRLQVR
jgi:hypothetical protein